MSKLQHIIHSPALKFGLILAFLSTLIFGNVKSVSARAGDISDPSELTPEASALTTCPDAEIIFAHGAAADILDSQDISAWYNAFKEQGFSESELNLDYYYLGESTYNDARYNGANIGISSLTSVQNTLETLLSGGKSGEFQDSVKAGLTELSGRVQEILTKCPSTKFIFGGYSEGAYILHQFFKDMAESLGLTTEKVIYIATFGDPKLYLKEGEGTHPPACRNEGFSSYRIYAPNCRTHSGILGAEQPDYFPTEYLKKTGLWCTWKDIMCSNYFSIFSISDGINDHLNYANHKPYPYKQAAIIIRQKLAEIFPEKISKGEGTVHSAARDTAILIDTTGSMSSTISKYKTEALKIAKSTIENGGRIALYEYRDLKADGKELIPRELCDFSCTYAKFTQEINHLKPSGGGDKPESVLSASLGVMNKLSWMKGATKSIVLLTDAAYHDADFDGTTLTDVVRRSLEIDPVNFYIIAPDSIASNYTSLATQTGGKVFTLSAQDIALSSKTLLNRPDLNFQQESYEFTTNEIASFFVSTSAINLDHFEWDLDFDGVFEITTTSGNLNHLYTSPASGYVQAKIVTKTGLSSTASAFVSVKVEETPEKAPVISTFTTNLADGSVKVSYQKSEDTATTIVFLDDYALGSTSETELTITDLTTGKHTISLTPISSTGLRGNSITKTINTHATLPKVPNTGKL